VSCQQHSHGRERRTLLTETTHTGKKKKPQQLPPCLSPATVIHCEQEGGHTSTAEREETLLTERTKNRGRNQHSEAEGRRRKTAASATVCHHRWHHAALHAGQTTAIAGQPSSPLLLLLLPPLLPRCSLHEQQA
jgi:hypothetical protein